MSKPINEMTYPELLAAIEKADKLPEKVRAQHAERYANLCAAAAEHELTSRKFPAHSICDPVTRDIVSKLLRDVYTLAKLPANQDFRKSCSTILSDLMALATTPDHRVLEIFGYKDVAEDDV